MTSVNFYYRTDHTKFNQVFPIKSTFASLIGFFVRFYFDNKSSNCVILETSWRKNSIQIIHTTSPGTVIISPQTIDEMKNLTKGDDGEFLYDFARDRLVYDFKAKKELQNFSILPPTSIVKTGSHFVAALYKNGKIDSICRLTRDSDNLQDVIYFINRLDNNLLCWGKPTEEGLKTAFYLFSSLRVCDMKILTNKVKPLEFFSIMNFISKPKIDIKSKNCRELQKFIASLYEANIPIAAGVEEIEE